MALILCMLILPFAGGIISYVIGNKRQEFLDIFACVITAAELVLGILLFVNGEFLTGIEAFSFPLSFTGGGIHSAYAVITAFMWFVTEIFAKEYFAHERQNLGRYQMFMLMTLSATEGVMLSADLMTAFVFFEILSFTSFTWVIHEESREAVKAAYTYLFIAIFGGMVLFAGLAMLQQAAGTLSFAHLPSAVPGAMELHPRMLYASGICILIGFGAKAGMFPLHVWLPMAHPIAPSPASALLSGVLTKVGIYGILACAQFVLSESTSFGIVVLILGLITMVLGAVLALLSENLKRTLACSSMSQIGFILTGIAMMVLFSAAGDEEGYRLAFSGVILHMVNHSMIKLALFCAAGVVVMNIHRLGLKEITGWGREKRLLKISFLLGALGISGMPVFNGYISKTLLHESITEAAGSVSSIALLLHVSEWIFIISGGLTFAYMLRLFIRVFALKNEDEKLQEEYDKKKDYMSHLSGAAIFLSACICAVLGQPPVSGRIAAFVTGGENMISYGSAFSGESLLGAFISLAVGAGVYLLAVRNIEKARYDSAGRDHEKLPYGQVFVMMGEAVLKVVSSVIRMLDMGMDAPVFILSHIVSKEQKKEDHHTAVYSVFDFILTGRRDQTYLKESFSMALMMTCIGILIILFVLVVTVL